MTLSVWRYGVATIGRLFKITGLFCRILSLLQGSFANETYNSKEPTNRSHPIVQVEHDIACLAIVQMVCLAIVQIHLNLNLHYPNSWLGCLKFMIWLSGEHDYCQTAKSWTQIALSNIHYRQTAKLIERNPPPGGVSYLLCSLIKNHV